MRYYTWTVETLSPVHIGCETKLSKLDYVYDADQGLVYVMDQRELFRGLSACGLLEDYEMRIANGETTFSLTKFLRGAGIGTEDYAAWAQYSYPVDNVSIDPGQFEIVAFVKDAYGCPYIPGSGLKGAIRTLLASDVIRQESGRFQRTTAALKAWMKEKCPDLKDLRSGRTEQEIFCKLKRDEKKWYAVVNDCMTGLKISDSHPLDSDALTLCQKIDLAYEGETHSINILRECLKPGTRITFDVTVDETQFPWDMDSILDALDHGFDDYDALFRGRYVEKARDTFHLPQAPGEGAYLYLGGGTGFLHKTYLTSFFADDLDAAEITSIVLDKMFKTPKHRRFTENTGYSPKVLKCTRYHEQLYEMGLCRLIMKEKKR